MPQGWMIIGLILLAGTGCLDFISKNRRALLTGLVAMLVLPVILPANSMWEARAAIAAGLGVVWLSAARRPQRWQWLAGFGLAASGTLLVRLLIPFAVDQALGAWLLSGLLIFLSACACQNFHCALAGAAIALPAQECLYAVCAGYLKYPYAPRVEGGFELLACGLALCGIWALVETTVTAKKRQAFVTQLTINN